jgi:hypothetical protein
VGQYNEGMTALKSELLSPVLGKAREAAKPTWSSKERRAKISAARKGKPRPAHLVEAMREGRTGKPHDQQTRRKMSQAQRARQRPDGWTTREDEWVRTLPANRPALLLPRAKERPGMNWPSPLPLAGARADC